MNEVFGMYSHMNVLQRDMCPSATRFEGEIIAMTLDLMHGERGQADDEPVGIITSGGTGSILHSVLAYREWGAQREGHRAPEHHQARDRAPGVRQGVPPPRRRAPPGADRPGDRAGRRRRGRRAHRRQHRRDDRLRVQLRLRHHRPDRGDGSTLALERGVGLHVDGCLGGFILPWGEQLGYDIPPFDFRIPGVTSISADTHKYAYGLKGTSVLLVPRQVAAQRPVLLPDRLDRREVLLPRHRRLPLRRTARGDVGGDGVARPRGLPRLRAARLRDRVRDAGRGALALRAADHRHADVLLQLHVGRVRHLPRERLHADEGLALQRPAVPELDPHGRDPPADPTGSRRRVRDDLAEAVVYAIEHRDEAPKSAAIYGGVSGGPTADADEFIRAVMAEMMDRQQSLPALS